MMDGANGKSNDMVSMGKILDILQLSGIENWLVVDCERKKMERMSLMVLANTRGRI